MPTTFADWFTIAGVAIALVALAFSWWESRGNRRATSADLYVSIIQMKRDEWKAFDAAASQDQQEEILSEILNQVEIACAFYNDKILAGRSRLFLENTLRDILTETEKNPKIQALRSKLRTHPHTFHETEAFMERQRKLRSRTGSQKSQLASPPTK